MFVPKNTFRTWFTLTLHVNSTTCFNRLLQTNYWILFKIIKASFWPYFLYPWYSSLPEKRSELRWQDVNTFKTFWDFNPSPSRLARGFFIWHRFHSRRFSSIFKKKLSIIFLLNITHTIHKTMAALCEWLRNFSATCMYCSLFKFRVTCVPPYPLLHLLTSYKKNDLILVTFEPKEVHFCVSKNGILASDWGF